MNFYDFTKNLYLLLIFLFIGICNHTCAYACFPWVILQLVTVNRLKFDNSSTHFFVVFSLSHFYAGMFYPLLVSGCFMSFFL